MGEYVGNFGLKRYVGRGEATSPLYNASAKPAEGMHNCIEVVLNAEGPVVAGIDLMQAHIPAGAVVTRATILVDSENTASPITSISLVKKDGSDGKALFSNQALVAGKSVNAEANAEALIRYAEERYPVLDKAYAGLKGTLLIEYI
jgi:hypothetical protein